MSFLRVEGLTKRYGGLVAVRDMSFSVERGEILGLIGPNGSGKSTAMKLIMGIEKPNAGRVVIDGTDVAGWPSHRIARRGVGLVFQHSRPLARQTVLENIELALLPDSLVRLAGRGTGAGDVRARAAAIGERCGLGGVLERRPGTLPFADLRRMELAKAVARHPDLVLVDEPFAGLTAGEVADFSALIAGFRAEGRAVLLVDHNVKSVAALVDRALAMYLGERVTEGTAAEVMAHPRVREVYLGSGSMERVERPVAAAPRKPLLEVDGVSVLYGKAQALEGVGLRVAEGECVSVVGLNGAGKTTLFNAICGLVPCSGSVRWRGESLAGRTPAAIAREAGIVQCPESRELFGDMSVRENLELGGGHLVAAERRRQLAAMEALFPILAARAGQRARTLSGGEQQMLAIARALMMKPRLLILDEPTLGLAPVILEQISHAIEALRQAGEVTLLLGEQNVTFALPHADRVYVLEHGRVAWEGPAGRFAAEAGAGLL